RLSPAGSRGNHLDVVLQGQQARQGLPDQGLVLGQHHCDHGPFLPGGSTASIRNQPSRVPTCTVPPVASTRSRIPVKPAPSVIPRPGGSSSAIRSTTPPSGVGPTCSSTV